jgi:hypothetical protein
MPSPGGVGARQSISTFSSARPSSERPSSERPSIDRVSVSSAGSADGGPISSPADDPGSRHPSFAEALRARLQGTVPVLTLQAATDLACTVAESAVVGQGIGGAAASSLVSSSMKLGVESALHIGLSAAGQTKMWQRVVDRVAGKNGTKENMLSHIRAVSAVLSTANGGMIDMGFSAAASAALKQAPTIATSGFARMNSLASMGVVSASAVALYKTNAAFKAEVDKSLGAVYDSIVNRFRSSPGDAGDQADAMELGEIRDSGAASPSGA